MSDAADANEVIEQALIETTVDILHRFDEPLRHGFVGYKLKTDYHYYKEVVTHQIKEDLL